MTTPITMAAKPGQNPKPSVKAKVPVKTLESSIFGANHTVKFRHDESVPLVLRNWGHAMTSTTRSPRCVGRVPAKTSGPATAVEEQPLIRRIDH